MAVKQSETEGFLNPSASTEPKTSEPYQSKTKEIDN